MQSWHVRASLNAKSRRFFSEFYKLQILSNKDNALSSWILHDYGIQPERLTVSSMEGDEQPFAENDWNRVVIMIAD